MSQRHIIQRTIVDLQLPSQSQAHAQQAAVSRLFQEALPKAMDAVFSALVPPNHVLKLERLEVDLGHILDNDFSEKTFETRCLVALEKALKTAISQQLVEQTAEDVFISPEATAFEAFVFFIKNGRLPWSFRVESEESWLFQVLTTVEKVPKSAHILRGVILSNSDRLVQQFPLSFLWILIEKLFPEWAKLGLTDIKQAAKNFESTPFWKDFLHTILRIAKQHNTAIVGKLLTQIEVELKQPNATTFLKQVTILRLKEVVKAATDVKIEKNDPLSKIAQNERVPDRIEEKVIDLNKTAQNEQAHDKVEEKAIDLNKTPQNERVHDRIEEKAIYLNQAGLVIVFPFIESFLKNVQLLDNKVFVDEEAREKAVHLLHYLATGKTNAAEYDLILEKILCGIPLSISMERDIVLSDSDQKAADNLLVTVIKYWTALGACSADGLRETFLQRPAKLTITDDDNWLLQIERRTVDILMDKLPWGCSMIKTAWMSRFMVVEW